MLEKLQRFIVIRFRITYAKIVVFIGKVYVYGVLSDPAFATRNIVYIVVLLEK